LAVQKDPRSLFQLAAKEACRLGKSDSAAIWTVSEGSPRLTVRAWHPAAISALPSAGSRTCLGKVLREGKPVCFSRGQLSRSWLSKHLGKTPAALLPLQGEERIWGVICLAGGKREAFSSEEMEWLGMIAAQVEAGLEAFLAHQESEQSLIQLADLSGTAGRMASCADFASLMKATVRATASALHCPIVAVALSDESGHLRLAPHGHLGIAASRARNLRLMLEPEGVFQRILKKGETLALPKESQQAERLSGSLAAKSAACAPLPGAEGPLGVLLVGHRGCHDFCSAELILLSAYAGQTAIALRNALICDDFTKHLDRLAAFSEYARTLASSLDMDETLQTVLRSAASLLEADCACILLKKPESKRVELRACLGFSGQVNSWAAKNAPEEGNGLVGLALEQDKILVSRDLSRDGRCKERSFLRDKGPVSAVIAPLKARGKNIGALCLFTNKPRNFTEQDKRLVSMLTDGAGIAIENARLYQEEKQRSSLLSGFIHEANHRIRNSLQAVAGLLEMEASCEDHSPREALRKSIDRIHCIGAVHGLLSRKNLQQVEMKESARRIAKIVGQSLELPADSLVTISGARVMLESREATALSLALNELLDNALRHGLGSGRQGKVHVSFTQLNREIMVTVNDDGAGLPEGFDVARDAGMGLKTAAGLVAQDLNGELRLFSKNGGATAQIRFPRETGVESRPEVSPRKQD
jgi:two-component sensor histidine kinase